jgi:hypothetical protein
MVTLYSCAGEAPAPQTEFVLGTVCTVNLFAKGTREAYREIFERLREIEARMSANRDDSEIAEINRNAGIAPVRVHPDVIDVVSTPSATAELSDGASIFHRPGSNSGTSAPTTPLPAAAEIEADFPSSTTFRWSWSGGRHRLPKRRG